MLRIDGEGVTIAYRKMWLGGAEPFRFSAGSEPVALDVDGWRVGLGICKDTGVREHARVTAALSIDLFAAGLVHLPTELAEQEARAVRIAAMTGVPVAFASFAGTAGGGYDRTAGRSCIWSSDGDVVDRAVVRKEVQ
jgi:predicted amidohydrolase